MMLSMHDWTLLSVEVEWATGRVQVRLTSPAGPVAIDASGLLDLHLPRVQNWGRSVTIYSVDGPTLREDELSHLAIEMQSGDVIEIVARSFKMPDGHQPHP